ncbi:protein OSB2, chloroplastic-like isoform X2 [Phoenix dactylifera]|uniref:Protein OSB2, chloroplastic-like isoform X2 n=1 Tax=Phoenix dactylifera TaxID=42345 RepID=A0A8B8J8I1_PHODC|nr:protein OSB2, chloroplastic-like isoform X2 [Phoenix dactylifera]
MNLSRAFASLFSSSSFQSRKLSIRPIAVAAFQSSALFSTDVAAAAPAKRNYKGKPKPKPEKDPLGFSNSDWNPSGHKDLPRPTEVPYQPKVANSVHLVGTIGVPVQLQTLPNGLYAAVSVLVQENTKGLPQLWIPIIFQGDLAQCAACHLKENDLIYVIGKLSGDVPPFTIKDAQTKIQVLAHSVSFVQKECPEKEGQKVSEKHEVASDSSAELEENSSGLHLWNDLLANPREWWDNRSNQSHPKSAAFRHQESGQLLWINDSTPEWVLSKLDGLSFRNSGNLRKPESLKKPESSMKLWSDLVVNPQQWRDNRMDKANGLKISKYPDFTHKDTWIGLWLDRAPDWVLPKLGGLVFIGSNNTENQETKENVAQAQNTENGIVGGEIHKFNKGKKSSAVSKNKNDEDLWRSLVDSPSKWWDNRSSKLKPNYPDFKHKDTGKGLWLGSYTPQWVLQRLPPLNTEKKVVGHKKATLGTATLPS